MRRDAKRHTRSALCVATVAAWMGVGCDEPVSSDARRVAPPAMSTRLETCAAGAVVTGGGWIDPAATGKTTFGLNVHVNDLCEPVRGQLEVVNHRTQSQHHSTEISTFESFANLEGGDCGRWTGTLRAKNGDGSWHTGAFEVEACDNGEPGRGRDTFSFTFEGEGSTGRAVLRGGNIRVRGDGNGPVPL